MEAADIQRRLTLGNNVEITRFDGTKSIGSLEYISLNEIGVTVKGRRVNISNSSIKYCRELRSYSGQREYFQRNTASDNTYNKENNTNGKTKFQEYMELKISINDFVNEGKVKQAILAAAKLLDYEEYADESLKAICWFIDNVTGEFQLSDFDKLKAALEKLSDKDNNYSAQRLIPNIYLKCSCLEQYVDESLKLCVMNPAKMKKEKLGVFALKNKLYNKAEEVFQYILQEEPENRCALLGMEIIADIRNGEKVNEEFYKYMEKYPYIPPIWKINELVIEYINEGRLDYGISIFKYISKLYPLDLPANVAYAALLVEESSSKNVETAFGVLVSLLNTATRMDIFERAFRTVMLLAFEYDLEDRLDNLLTLYNKKEFITDRTAYTSRKAKFKVLKSFKDSLAYEHKDEFKKLCKAFRFENAENIKKVLFSLLDGNLINYELGNLILKVFKGPSMRILIQDAFAHNTAEEWMGSKGVSILKYINEELFHIIEAILLDNSKGIIDKNSYGDIIRDKINNEKVVRFILGEDKQKFKIKAFKLLGALSDAKVIYKIFLAEIAKMEDSSSIFNNFEIYIEALPSGMAYGKLAHLYYEEGMFDYAEKYYRAALDKYSSSIHMDHKKVFMKYYCVCTLVNKWGGNIDFNEFDKMQLVIGLWEITKEGLADLNKLKTEDERVILLLEGHKKKKFNDFESAYDDYRKLIPLDEEMYFAAISRLANRIQKKNGSRMLLEAIEKEIEQMNVKSIFSDEEDELDNSDEVNSMYLEEGIEDIDNIENICPALISNFTSYKLEDNRPGDMILKEIELALNSNPEIQVLVDLLQKKTYIYYKNGDNDSFVDSLILFGNQEARARLSLGEYDLSRKYSLETMMLSSYYKKRTEIIKSVFEIYLRGAAKYERPNDLAGEKKDLQWIYISVVSKYNMVSINRPFKEFIQIAELLEKYAETEVVDNKIKLKNDINNAINRIKVNDPKFRDIFLKITQNLRLLMYKEGGKLYKEPNIQVHIQNIATEKRSPLFLEIENTGLGNAENVIINLDLLQKGKIRGNSFVNIGRVRGGEKVYHRFDVRMNSEGEVEIEVSCEFTTTTNKLKSFTNKEVLSVINNSEDEFVSLDDRYHLKAVSDKSQFYGRDKIIGEIASNLKGSKYDNVMVITGLRRVGKTSILNYIRFSSDQSIVPVFIDLEGKGASDNTRDFVYFAILSSIEIALKEINIDIKIPPIEYFNESTVLKMVHFFDNELSAALRGKKLLFMMDEFEMLLKLTSANIVDPNILHAFRHLMQHNDNLRFIIAGADKVVEMLRDYASIIFNIAVSIRVWVLEKQDMINMIVNSVPEATYHPSSLDKIYSLTKGHPYYTKIICSGIINYLNEEERKIVYASDVEHVCDKLTRSTRIPYFDYLWDVDDLKKLIMSLLASELNHCDDKLSFSDIMRFFTGSSKFNKVEVAKTLEVLTDRGILEEISEEDEEKAYKFQIDLFRIWFKINKPLKKTIMEVGIDGSI